MSTPILLSHTHLRPRARPRCSARSRARRRRCASRTTPSRRRPWSRSSTSSRPSRRCVSRLSTTASTDPSSHGVYPLPVRVIIVWLSIFHRRRTTTALARAAAGTRTAAATPATACGRKRLAERDGGRGRPRGRGLAAAATSDGRERRATQRRLELEWRMVRRFFARTDESAKKPTTFRNLSQASGVVYSLFDIVHLFRGTPGEGGGRPVISHQISGEKKEGPSASGRATFWGDYSRASRGENLATRRSQHRCVYRVRGAK